MRDLIGKQTGENPNGKTRQEAIRNVEVGRDLVIGSLEQVNGRVVEVVKSRLILGLVLLLALVGILGMFFAAPRGNQVESGGILTEEIKIFQGDSEEVREKKFNHAQRLLAEEVLGVIASLDARLGFVKVVLAEEEFGNQLDRVRSEVAPESRDRQDQGYRELMLQQKVAELRAAFTSQSLEFLGESLIQVLLDGGVDVTGIRHFQAQLSEVEVVSESVLKSLSAREGQPCEGERSSSGVQRQGEIVELAARRLAHRSSGAYLAGLDILADLPIGAAENRLAALNHLRPRRLVDCKEKIRILEGLAKEAEEILSEQSKQLAWARRERDGALSCFLALLGELDIKDDDSWDLVVAKAISLRQLGRIPDAAAAFWRYGEKFSGTDPTATRYARTAQQFTLQLKALGVDGGVYLYEVARGGQAMSVGLSEGDILIGYGGLSISNMLDITKALQALQTSPKPVRVTFLRMQESGSFKRAVAVIASGPLGVGMMPI